MQHSGHNLPDWEKIFLDRPDLRPPGYTEACANVASNQSGLDTEIARARMRQINSDRQKLKTKNRAATKKRQRSQAS
jgi:hypothetical protein